MPKGKNTTPAPKERPSEFEQFQTLIKAAAAETKRLIKERNVTNMTQTILIQLAKNTTLIPRELAGAIVRGAVPPLEEIVQALLVNSEDCLGTLNCDPASTMNERRMARIGVGNTFLLALAITGSFADRGDWHSEGIGGPNV